MLKISAIFLVLIVSICNVYAANYQLIDAQNGSNGLVEFSCDQDVLLDDNKVIFISLARMLKLILSKYLAVILILLSIKSLKMSNE